MSHTYSQFKKFYDFQDESKIPSVNHTTEGILLLFITHFVYINIDQSKDWKAL